MSPIDIHSGLSDFRILSSIHRVDQTGIKGYASLNNRPLFTAIEALAQLGAMHVRWLCNFKKHGFLLKIERLTLPDSTTLQGDLFLEGELMTKSSASFAYNLTAAYGKDTLLSGTFLFSVIDYDNTFEQTHLKAHYKGLFSCLTSE